MGRFWSPDPGGIKTAVPTRPSSWNRYAYTEADPVNFYDPFGLYYCALPDDGVPVKGCSYPSFGVMAGYTSVYYSDPEGSGYTQGGSGTVIPNSGSGTSGFVGPIFSKCGQFGSTQDLAFVDNNYDAASAEAAAIESMMPSQVQANLTNLTDAFLDWSAWESGWGGSKMVTSMNNYFGYGSVTFPSSMTWGAELAYILGVVPVTPTNPNPSGLSYSNYLAQVLISNPNASPATLLQAIANAGYNTNTSYGSTITTGAGSSIAAMISCLQQNYGLH